VRAPYNGNKHENFQKVRAAFFRTRGASSKARMRPERLHVLLCVGKYNHYIV
jgi:hypothetical protein